MREKKVPKEMIFWGCGGQAKILKECLEHSEYKLVALFDNNENLKSPFPNVPLYSGLNGFPKWMSTRTSIKEICFLVAIGGDRGKERLEIQTFLESQGLTPLTAVHPSAFVSRDVKIGKGSQILAHSTVGVEVSVGQACIINTAASVDHECYLDDGVHIAPGAHLAGCVRIEKYAFIGTGAVIIPRIKIGEGAIVGAGAVVIRDVLPYTVVVGNPAKFLRKVGEKDEKSL